MKFSLSAIVVGLSTLAYSTLSIELSSVHTQRFLEQRDELLNELVQWKNSDSGITARIHGFYNDKVGVNALDDQLKRLYSTKQEIVKMSALNPKATFSINSPFTLLTTEEFAKFATGSFVQNGGRRMLDAFQNGDPVNSTSDSYFDALGNHDGGDNDGNHDGDDNDDDNDNDRNDDNNDSMVNSYQTMVGTPLEHHRRGWHHRRTRRPRTRAPCTRTPCPSNSPTSPPTDSPTNVPTDTPTNSPTDYPTDSPTMSPTDAPPKPSPSPNPNPGGDIDWSTSSCVAPIKNQGQCGSCWAFATVGSIESANCIKNGNLQTFSEQQITSCDTKSSGCNGGYPTGAIQYAAESGLCLSSDYPYTSGDSGDTGSCAANCNKVQVKCSAVDVTRDDDKSLVTAITKQPVVVVVSAGNNAWKQYNGGVLSSCDSSQVDHAVIAVGYTSEAYIIRNSWSTSWGDKGYIKLQRNSGGGGSGTCEVLSGPVYPDMS